MIITARHPARGPTEPGIPEPPYTYRYFTLLCTCKSATRAPAAVGVAIETERKNGLLPDFLHRARSGRAHSANALPGRVWFYPLVSVHCDSSLANFFKHCAKRPKPHVAFGHACSVCFVSCLEV